MSELEFTYRIRFSLPENPQSPGFNRREARGYAREVKVALEEQVSNVASRLCDEAKPGQILISPRVLVAIKDDVTVEAVGEFELKGIRRPVAAYYVLAATHPYA